MNLRYKNKMKFIINCFCVFIVILHIVFSENKFKSIPVTVKVFENDTVLLPCYLHDTEPTLSVRWYKNGSLLADSADSSLKLPVRFHVWNNHSLEVTSVNVGDTDDYMCEIIRPSPWGPIKQEHSIEVQFAPKVKIFPQIAFLSVKKGDYVDLKCEVEGVPGPIIDWKKNGDTIALLDHRSRLHFKAEHRLMGGLFQCIAYNGVGDEVSEYINVMVQDGPTVTAEQTCVHAAIGLRATLRALLKYDYPRSTRNWYKNGKTVNVDSRVYAMARSRDAYELIFSKVIEEDFGNYTFRAENFLGMSEVSFKLTGLPKEATFLVDTSINKATPTSFTLVWEVDSLSPVFEYNLWLRPYVGHSTVETLTANEPPGGLWSKIVVPGDLEHGPIHSASYQVRGLTPSTIYEALVSSRNRFGWSKTSPIVRFSTEHMSSYVKPIEDYEELRTPVFLEPDPVNETSNDIYPVSERIRESTDAAVKRNVSFRAILFVITLCKLLS